MKTGRRYKAYAGSTGVTYQYFFDTRRRVVRPEGWGAGSDYTFVITADQHPPYTLQIFLSDRALEAWKERHGRELDDNEQYAAAKMRLFQAFDECERLVEDRLNLVVDEGNIVALLDSLDLA